MGKIRVEICLISARGLYRAFGPWKGQYFAVGWIDSGNKYCTGIDASGNANPVWKTKFSAFIDPSEPGFRDAAIHIEVYSRGLVFLRDRLLGTTTVALKEFLEKFLKSSEGPKPVEDMGSFQLRHKWYNKPQGFVDISIRISEEREDPTSHQGDLERIKLMDNSNGINLDDVYGPSHLQSQTPFPRNYANAPAGPSYQPPPRRPTAGYIPTDPPRTDHVQPSYIPTARPGHGNRPGFGMGLGNMPVSGPTARPGHGNRPGFGMGLGNMPVSGPTTRPGHGNRPGFGMGLGAGAVAAGAAIFGDNFTSGLDITGGPREPGLPISTDHDILGDNFMSGLDFTGGPREPNF